MLQESYEKHSATVQRTMLGLFTVSAFCMVTTFSAPDSALLGAEVTVTIPFADAPISFQGFLFLGPILILLITLYLHIFYGYWLKSEQERKKFNSLIRKEPPIGNSVTLFSLDSFVPRFLTFLIFYGLAPIVLSTITWKALARPEWARPLLFVTALATFILIFLWIKRCPPLAWKLSKPIMWMSLAGVAGLTVNLYSTIEPLSRPMALMKADLRERWLPRAYLREADLRFALLQDANLSEANARGTDFSLANLEGADLHDANCVEAILERANLSNANLEGAQLQRARLNAANLRKALMYKTDLRDAKLTQANLENANLGDAILNNADLTNAQLQNAELRYTGLDEVRLYGANLQNAYFGDASLTKAVLTKADLKGAQFHGSNLDSVTGLTQAQIDQACLDEATKLPPQLSRPKPCIIPIE